GLRIKSDQTVAEKIVPRTVAAVKIKARCTERHICNASVFIDRHLAPIVNAAAGFIELCRPGVITELARMRNGMENPGQLARPDIVSMHVTGYGFITRAAGR